MGNHPRAVTLRMSPEPDPLSYPTRYRPAVWYPHTGPHAMVRWWTQCEASRVILAKSAAGLKPTLRRVIANAAAGGGSGARKIKIEEVAAVRLVAPPDSYVRLYAREVERREFVSYWREVSLALRSILLKGGEPPGGFGECPVHRIGRLWDTESDEDPMAMDAPGECCFFGVVPPPAGPDYWGRFRALREDWHRAQLDYRSACSLARPRPEKAPTPPRTSPEGVYDPAEGPLYAVGNRGFQGGLELSEVELDRAPALAGPVSFYFQRTPGAAPPLVEPEWLEQVHREAARRRETAAEVRVAAMAEKRGRAEAVVAETYWREL